MQHGKITIQEAQIVIQYTKISVKFLIDNCVKKIVNSLPVLLAPGTPPPRRHSSRRRKGNSKGEKGMGREEGKLSLRMATPQPF